MANLQLKIRPLLVPNSVLVDIPGSHEPVEVQLNELDEGTLLELLEEFNANALAVLGGKSA